MVSRNESAANGLLAVPLHHRPAQAPLHFLVSPRSMVVWLAPDRLQMSVGSKPSE